MTFLADIQDRIATLALQIGAAILILLLGYLAASLARRSAVFLARRLNRGMGDELTWWRRHFLIPSLVFLSVFLLSVVGALSVLGIAATVVGAAISLAISLGFAADIYNGFQMLNQSEFRIGDMLEIPGENAVGVVAAKSLRMITLLTADRREVIIPVKRALAATIVSRARNIGYMTFEIRLPQDTDIPAVEACIAAVAEQIGAIQELSCELLRLDRAVIALAIRFYRKECFGLSSVFMCAVVSSFKQQNITLLGIAPGLGNLLPIA
jgi:small-conductance mechanosensitive channel